MFGLTIFFGILVFTAGFIYYLADKDPKRSMDIGLGGCVLQKRHCVKCGCYENVLFLPKQVWKSYKYECTTCVGDIERWVFRDELWDFFVREFNNSDYKDEIERIKMLMVKEKNRLLKISIPPDLFEPPQSQPPPCFKFSEINPEVDPEVNPKDNLFEEEMKKQEDYYDRLQRDHLKKQEDYRRLDEEIERHKSKSSDADNRRVRVYEIAKDLGMSSRDLVAKLILLGYDIKGHSSSVDYETAMLIRKTFLDEEYKPKDGPTVIRRRSTVLTPDEDPVPEFSTPPALANTKEDITSWNKFLYSMIRKILDDYSITGIGKAAGLMKDKVPFPIYKKLSFLSQIRTKYEHDLTYTPSDKILDDYNRTANEVWLYLCEEFRDKLVS